MAPLHICSLKAHAWPMSRTSEFNNNRYKSLPHNTLPSNATPTWPPPWPEGPFSISPTLHCGCEHFNAPWHFKGLHRTRISPLRFLPYHPWRLFTDSRRLCPEIIQTFVAQVRFRNHSFPHHHAEDLHRRCRDECSKSAKMVGGISHSHRTTTFLVKRACLGGHSPSNFRRRRNERRTSSLAFVATPENSVVACRKWTSFPQKVIQVHQHHHRWPVHTSKRSKTSPFHVPCALQFPIVLCSVKDPISY